MVDSHHHFWTRSRGDYAWLTEVLGPIYRDFGPTDIAPLIKAAGIEKTVLVQAAPTVAETRFMLEIATNTDFVAGVVGWVDFEAHDVADQIAKLSRHPKLKGFRPMIHDLADDDWMLRPDIVPAFRSIIDHGLTFDALVFPRHLNNLMTLLSRFPDMKVVIDHGAKAQIGENLFEPWATDMTALAENTRAYCKVSGLITEDGPDWSQERLRPYVEHLLKIFGSERLMWGSDWPVVNLVGDYPSWMNAAHNIFSDLTDQEKTSIFGNNAVNFYSLTW